MMSLPAASPNINHTKGLLHGFHNHTPLANNMRVPLRVLITLLIAVASVAFSFTATTYVCPAALTAAALYAK